MTDDLELGHGLPAPSFGTHPPKPGIAGAMPDVLAKKSLADMDLTLRDVNALGANGVRVAGDLVGMSARAILDMPWIEGDTLGRLSRALAVASPCRGGLGAFPFMAVAPDPEDAITVLG